MTVASLLFLNRSGPAEVPETSRRALRSLESPPASPPHPHEPQKAEHASSPMLPRSIIPRSQVLAGLIIHQERASVSVNCPQPFAAKLSYRCSVRHASGTPRNGGEGAAINEQPFGIDPVFDPRSPLYSLQAAQNVWEYYNASADSQEVSSNGLPHAFFPRTLPGRSNGFTVVIPV